MDGMSDARGSLQGDVVQKHGSFFVASPQGSSGAESRLLSLAQNGVLDKMTQISDG